MGADPRPASPQWEAPWGCGGGLRVGGVEGRGGCGRGDRVLSSPRPPLEGRYGREGGGGEGGDGRTALYMPPLGGGQGYCWGGILEGIVVDCQGCWDYCRLVILLVRVLLSSYCSMLYCLLLYVIMVVCCMLYRMHVRLFVLSLSWLLIYVVQILLLLLYVVI